MHFLYFSRLKLTKIVQNRDWYNIQKFTILKLYLKQNINKSLKTKVCQKFSKLKKNENAGENPFNLNYFAYFSSNHVISVFKDTFTLEKANKKVNSAKICFSLKRASSGI